MNNYVIDFREALMSAGKSENTVNTYAANAQLFIEWLEKVMGETFS